MKTNNSDHEKQFIANGLTDLIENFCKEFGEANDAAAYANYLIFCITGGMALKNEGRVAFHDYVKEIIDKA